MKLARITFTGTRKKVSAVLYQLTDPFSFTPEGYVTLDTPKGNITLALIRDGGCKVLDAIEVHS